MVPRFLQWLRDPPPSMIFEVTEQGVALARMGNKSRLPEAVWFESLAPGAVEASPIRENVHHADELDRALAQLMAQANSPRQRKETALLLPDNCARMTVLEFEKLPGDARERLSLLRWRLKKSVPFDVETASLAYHVQRTTARSGSTGISAVVTVSPAEVIGQYEAAVRRLGLVPGYVSTSVAAALNLVAEQGVTMLAKLAGPVLTLVVINEGAVRMVRTLPAESGMITEEALREMAADLYPTFVYVADNLGAPVSRLVLAGFGDALPAASEVFRYELGCEPQPLTGPLGVLDTKSAGIWGYLSAS